MKALILTDGKAGHENQSKAFARALGCDFDLVTVRFRSKAAKALSYLFDHLGIHTAHLFTLNSSTPQQLNTSTPQLIIGTGSGTFYAAKTLARQMGVPCGVVLYPRGYRIGTFDCILAPAFDNPPPAPNVIEIPVNLVAADAEFYANGVKAFRERHADSGRPAVAVIIGGPNKCSTMTPGWMRAQLEAIFAAHSQKQDTQTLKHSSTQTLKHSNTQELKHSNTQTLKHSNTQTLKHSNNLPPPEFWVTTSRRTPPEVEAVVDSFPFDYKLLYSRDHFNPIPAFVSLASHLYVTAESTGMLSEACSFGTAQVHVMDNLKPGPHKFRRFAEACSARGASKADLSIQFAAARRLLGLNP